MTEMNSKYKLLVLAGMICGAMLLSFTLNLNLPHQRSPNVLAVIDIVPTPTLIPTPTPKPFPPEPEISSMSYIIKETWKDPLFGKEIHNRLPPASTTKIATALVATRKYDFNKQISVLKNYELGATIGLQKGEIISTQNLLYGLLLNSGNDAAMALADGLENPDEFISQMNEEVSRLGLQNTQFVNPSGLDHPDHYSSAYDLAVLGEALLANPELAKIVSTKNTVIYDSERKISHVLENRNKLLEIPGVVGIKTGYTDTAGEVLVTAIIRNEKTYIIVVMGSKNRFDDTKELITWLDNYLSE